jgi:hypothetical protein
MMTFLLTVALSSSFITIQNSRPTQAESLLYTVTCIVGGLVSYNCPSNTKPTPPPEQPTQTQPTNTQQTTDTSQTIEMNQELLTQLPTIPEVKPVLFESGTENFVLPTARGVSTVSRGVLGVSDTPALRATSQGWNIIGVPWYWWMLAISGVAGLYVAARAFINRSSVGIVE